jgi:hypothetical protein
MGFTPEILPIMGVHALGFIMLTIKRAPLSLKVVHIELSISGHVVYQPRFDV